MRQVQTGDTVKVHYLAKTGTEKIFDSKNLPEPLQITLGKEEIIPPLEDALIGMQQGEKKTISIASEQAFGPRINELISTIDRKKLPPDIKLEVGKQLQVQNPDGSVLLVTIMNVDPQTVTLDANHPLAGKDLTFDIELMEIISSK
ncbi:MAG: peptidylprolyl isomerase [Parachlamydiales bacterium]|nr:peptidylprolyl isomerase [Parachlamydiales bacterium]